MLKSIFKKTLFAAAFAAAMCATASANIVIDLDPKEGDQGMRSKQVKPGEVVELELVAQQGAQDIEGFEIQAEFDTKQLLFKGFQPSGLMAGAIALPPQTSTTGIKISVGFLGKKSPGDSGSLGKIQIEVAQGAQGAMKVALTQGAYGAKGQTKNFSLSSGVELVAPGGTTTDMGQTQQPGPQGGMGGPQGGMGGPQGQPQGGGFQSPGQGGPPQGQGYHGGPQNQPSPQEMQQMYNRWRGSREAKDLNGDRRINQEDFKMWFAQRQGPQGQPQGQGYHGGPQGGTGGPQGQPQGQGYHGGPQGGMGGPQGGMGGPQGQPQGQGYHGGPQGGMGGPQGGMGEHHMGGPMGHEGPNPEEMIKHLPQALQGSFTSTWKMSERAHLEAELKSQEEILKTLTETKKYAASAKPEEKEAIAKVLMFFHYEGGGEHRGGPGGPGMGGPGGPGMGGPGGPGMGGPGGPGMGGSGSPGMGGPDMPKDMDLNKLIDQMMKEVREDMAEIKRELSELN